MEIYYYPISTILGIYKIPSNGLWMLPWWKHFYWQAVNSIRFPDLKGWFLVMWWSSARIDPVVVVKNTTQLGNLLHSYWKWPFIASFPIKHGDFPVRYVKVYQRVVPIFSMHGRFINTKTSRITQSCRFNYTINGASGLQMLVLPSFSNWRISIGYILPLVNPLHTRTIDIGVAHGTFLSFYHHLEVS